MTTIALEQARQHLETLGLKQAVEALDNTLDTAAGKQLTYPEMLARGAPKTVEFTPPLANGSPPLNEFALRLRFYQLKLLAGCALNTKEDCQFPFSLTPGRPTQGKCN